jgi:4,4'-diaponeurosporenoate glycosyltransferase
MLLVLPLLALLCAPALIFVFGRPRTLPAGDKEGAKLTIIIPARDEEKNLALLLLTLTKGDHLEIIVADDQSSDDTAEVARSHGAKVISCPTLPAGWKGKPWACQTAATHASGDHLLFLDADTRLEPEALSLLNSHLPLSGEALSICPYHLVRRSYEQLSAIPNLAMAAGINAFAIPPGPSLLFGQSLLISRDDYEKSGGHNAVRGEILENVHYASQLRHLGINPIAYLGAGIVTMRMFPEGFGQLWQSWKKSFTTGAASAHPRALFLISLWITGAMLAIASSVLAWTSLATPSFQILAATAYLLYAGQLFGALRRLGSYSPLTSLFFPIPLLFYQTLFFSSLLDRGLGRKTKWKGRAMD